MAIEALSVKLTVEVDFHTRHPDYVYIRLYEAEDAPDSYRNFLTMGSLYNRVMDLRRPEDQRLYRWSEGDAKFLRFLGREIVPKLRATDFRAVHFPLRLDRFQEWRQEFALEPGRFINRDDQRAIPAPGQTCALSQRFVLSEKGAPPGQFRIEAFLLFPDGTRKTAHELLRSLGAGPTGDLSRKELFQAELPVPWPRLVKYFNRPVSTIQKNRAPELLPQLLYGHLELLEGPCVVRENDPAPISARLVIGLKERHFVVQGQLGNRPIDLTGGADTVFISRLFLNAKGQLVLGTRKPDESLQKIRGILQELTKRPQAVADNAAVRFPENHDNAQYLAMVWRKLPPEMPKSATLELHELLTSEKQSDAELRPRLTITDAGAFVKVHVNWNVAGHTCSLEAVQALLTTNQSVLQDVRGHWLSIDPEAARAARARLQALGFFQDGEEEQGDTTLLRTAAQRTFRRIRNEMHLTFADEDSRNFLNTLANVPAPEVKLPERDRARLRPYQQEGVEFLADRAFCGLGSLLADDMGLGKTLQVLTTLAFFRERRKGGRDFRALVVCPGSVVGVWIAQARQFFPELPLVAVTGSASQRKALLNAERQDVVFVTHYGLLRSDAANYSAHQFDFLVADEAQFLKNPEAQVTLAIKSLQANHRIALTGTPLENRLLDVWSIMDFLNPRYLGENRLDFTRRFTAPAALARKIKPLMLRRTKDQVAAELPPRTVTVLPVTLADNQREFYDNELLRARRSVHASGPVEILAALTRLREICCAPELLLKQAHGQGAAKLEFLLEQCAELLSNGHSVLVFSQFAKMLEIIARELNARDMKHYLITGETPLEARGRIVHQFQEDTANAILLLSLKAAGTGLTLTRADYVFLFDPWWNPAAENQAIDRTHRIGQTHPVFAYRLIARDTVEERVLELMRAKQELFDTVIGGAAADGVPTHLTREDLAALLE